MMAYSAAIEREPDQTGPVDACSSAAAAEVWLLDPWCRTPWYTAELTHALERVGYPIRMACPSYHLEPRYFHDQGIKTRPGIVDVAARAGWMPSGMVRPARFVEYGINSASLAVQAMLRPPRIVHQQQCVLLEKGWKIELELLRWLKRHGARIVHTVHNVLPHVVKPFHAEVFRELYRMADALICHDPTAAEALKDGFAIQPQKIHVIPHGPLFAQVPELSPEDARKELGLPVHRRIFLAQGVLARYKGFDLLLDAWADVVRRDGSTVRPFLVIAGTGPGEEVAMLRRKAAELGLGSSVHFDFGYIPAHKVPLYFQAADVLVYPYREITTSGALLTGLNYRKPIIASDLAALRNYLVHDVNALMVTSGDRVALANALAAICENNTCTRLAAGSENNPLLQTQWDEIARRTAGVYESVLA